ncbi:Endonuclease-reverse transcriptase [Operophtera brumata]|uniref:Endonuclease-reverse transcriptase n=1 Tax=Operophtera brumata TaxID=104452 RepID=A0A0L7KV13_OPEBR|nr:Endonuclease-reverse transcriptase [Operophtera brumata]
MEEIMNLLRNMQEENRQMKQDMADMKEDIKNTINSNINQKFKCLEEKNKILENKIQKNKKKLENTPYYIKEDYPPEILNKRKELQIQLEKEREQGKMAFIKGSYKLDKTKKSRATYKNRKPPLTNEENARQYLEVLKEGVLELSWQEHDNIESYYKKIESTVIQSLSSVNSTETSKNIISHETKEMIKRRAELQGKHPRSKEEKKVLSDLYKTTNKLLKKDYEKHRMDTIEENLRKKRSQKRAYKQLDSNKTWVQKLKTSQSSLRYTETRTDIVKTATEYYRELYSCQIYDKIPKNPTETELVQLVESFKEIEILKKIVALKPEKSPGPDGIPNEASRMR